MARTSKTSGTRLGERNVLVLQGGGALGAYQAGVYETLAEYGHDPSWVAGISIGAINAALIVGNPPERRLERLTTFWDMVSSRLLIDPTIPGDRGRSLFNETSATMALVLGAPGFFEPRIPPPALQLEGSLEALSFYDTRPLRSTLESLVDFDRINHGDVRLSVGAVNVGTGNFSYFDNRRQKIGPEHIMASGALPPGLPPIMVDGECYWDGGLVSNTPLQYVLDDLPRRDMLVFQVDLFCARGPIPRNLLEVVERDKDIRYSSRTRLNTDYFKYMQNMRRALHRLLERLPEELQDDADVKLLKQATCNAAVTIVHLIHRRKTFQGHSKDYEFSRRSIEDHWNAGRTDAINTFEHERWKRRDKPKDGVEVFDLAQKPST
ncbi:MAG TPA: patatin-like phospholipase family protein [Alphaproteobacteria bacterium]